jgi:hypothetical protein
MCQCKHRNASLNKLREVVTAMKAEAVVEYKSDQYTKEAKLVRAGKISGLDGVLAEIDGLDSLSSASLFTIASK